MIRPYLSDLINDHKTQGEWKVHSGNTVINYKTPKEIPVVFHNGSTYDYYFIINELAKEFQGEFECLAENTEKYTTFSVPIKKELDDGKTVTYKLKFVDRFRFMSSSLSSHVNDLSEHYNKM